MKVIASDFDGTLFFGKNNKISVSDIESIKAFQDKGNIFGACTGRPLEGLLYHCDNMIDFDFYIVSGGALILDKNYEELHSELLDYKSLAKLYNEYRDEVNFSIHSKTKIYIFEEITHPEIQIRINSLDEIKDIDILAVSIPTKSEEQAVKLASQINSNYEELSAVHNVEFVDVQKKGISKGTAINKLKELLDIKTINCIGDSYNDIPMFKVADYSFTFNYTASGVKEHVDELVDSVSEAIDIVSIRSN